MTNVDGQRGPPGKGWGGRRGGAGAGEKQVRFWRRPGKLSGSCARIPPTFRGDDACPRRAGQTPNPPTHPDPPTRPSQPSQRSPPIPPNPPNPPSLPIPFSPPNVSTFASPASTCG